jgi:DNA-binding Lrp family transcriptional regulator
MELKMLAELIKNSRRSDRELAKSIGTSQPTATRLRMKLEKEGIVREYTAVPSFAKIGYSILAITFVKLDLKLSQTKKELEAFKEKHYAEITKAPNAVVLMKRGMGLGYDVSIISLHEDYAACDQFRDAIREGMSSWVTDIDTFLVNIKEEKNSLPFSLSLLANHILHLPSDDKKARTSPPVRGPASA